MLLYSSVYLLLRVDEVLWVIEDVCFMMIPISYFSIIFMFYSLMIPLSYSNPL